MEEKKADPLVAEEKPGLKKTYPECVTPEDVLLLEHPTESFLCPMKANVFGIKFGAYKIRDIDTNVTLFEIKNEEEITEEEMEQMNELDDDEFRLIRYSFGPKFLDIKIIGTTLEFTIGGKALKSFRMIERHYFKDKLLRSYDFDFGFCIPGSTNTWEAIYELPEIKTEKREEIITNPWETKSDSFYFVEGKLVMHHKAEYNYAEEADPLFI